MTSELSGARAEEAPTFGGLGLPSVLERALASIGITSPTPIQTATLPDALAGRDVLGRGRTGSGKTFGFLLPTVARLIESPRKRVARRPRALVLAPTRELATQIGESLAPLAHATGLKYTVIFGGVGQKPQVDAVFGGVDIVIACPGRLLDLMGQKHVDLGAIEITVLDEADHMSDMGFLPMVRRILDATPADGQRMLFSATLDGAVGKVVKEYLHDAVTHSADPSSAAVTTMEHHVLQVEREHRFDVLRDLAASPGRTIMFTRTKYGAKNLAKKLSRSGVPAVEMHGNLSQGARVRNLDAFHAGDVGTLVCTDIAARGIHVDDVALVVHADPPIEHKAYLHRSGRTARAGESGTVITVQQPDQKKDVHDLMRAAKIKPAIHANVTAESDVLRDVAPGERVYGDIPESVAAPTQGRQPKGGGRGNGRSRGQGKNRGNQARGSEGANRQRSRSGNGSGDQPQDNDKRGQRSERRPARDGSAGTAAREANTARSRNRRTNDGANTAPRRRGGRRSASRPAGAPDGS